MNGCVEQFSCIVTTTSKQGKSNDVEFEIFYKSEV